MRGIHKLNFPTQILRFNLLVACNLHFSYWLHADFIGKRKYSSLSLKSFVIHPKMVYIWVCEGTNSYADYVLLGTYWITSTQHIYDYGFLNTYSTLSCLTSIHYLVSIFDSTHIDHSTFKVTQHMYYAWHLEFTWHLLYFWLGTYYSSTCIVYLDSIWKLVKCVDTQFSKLI